MKTGRPRKPMDQRKDITLHIRLTAAQRGILQSAAEQDGLDLSAWVRHQALTIARSRDADPTAHVQRPQRRGAGRAPTSTRVTRKR